MCPASSLKHVHIVALLLCCSGLVCRSNVEAAEAERDQALEAVGQLASKTDSLEEQLENLGRLLEEARERVSEKAQQLQHAEV